MTKEIEEILDRRKQGLASAAYCRWADDHSEPHETTLYVEGFDKALKIGKLIGRAELGDAEAEVELLQVLMNE